MFELEYGRMAAAFETAKKILIVIHKNPDGDAIGSALALKIYLTESGQKMATVYTVGPVSAAFDFLPKVETISTDRAILKEAWDLVVVLDCGDLDYAGVSGALPVDVTIVNLDHHVVNGFFGRINLVDSTAAAVSEIMFKFLRFCRWPIGRKIATCLLCGILHDTRGFANASTTGETVMIAGELVKLGAKISEVTFYGTKNKTIGGLRLWGLVLSRFKINRRLNLAYTYVKDEDFRLLNVTEAEMDGLASFLNVISEVAVSMFIRLGPNQARFSLRTTREDVDVSKIAGYFGGGGHKKAAGFVVSWQLEEIDGGLRVV